MKYVAAVMRPFTFACITTILIALSVAVMAWAGAILASMAACATSYGV